MELLHITMAHFIWSIIYEKIFKTSKKRIKLLITLEKIKISCENAGPIIQNDEIYWHTVSEICYRIYVCFVLIFLNLFIVMMFYKQILSHIV